MIDSREPKDGDYASYVESLVSAPKAQQIPETPPTGWGHGGGAGAPGAAPGALPGDPAGAVPGGFPRQAAGPHAGATRPDATRLDGGATRREAGGARPTAGATRPDASAGPLDGESLEMRLERLRRALPVASAGLPHLLRRIAGFATFAGIALIALSFSEDPPFFAHPFGGILLITAGAFLRRLARKLP
jgi:hypothetical protein